MQPVIIITKNYISGGTLNVTPFTHKSLMIQKLIISSLLPYKCSCVLQVNYVFTVLCISVFGVL